MVGRNKSIFFIEVRMTTEVTSIMKINLFSILFLPLNIKNNIINFILELDSIASNIY